MDSGGNILIRRLAIFARLACAASIAIAATAWIGWQFHLSTRAGLWPNPVTMRPLSAFGFLICAGSLALHLLARRPGGKTEVIARLLPLGTVAAAIASLARALARTVSPESLPVVEPPARSWWMPPATAIAFLFLAALLGLFEARAGRRARLWQPLAVLVTLLGLVQVLACFYGVNDSSTGLGQQPGALPTGLLFLMLGLAAFAVRGDTGWIAGFTSTMAGGHLARRVLPGALLLPAALGWILLWVRSFGFYGAGFGLALVVSLNIFTLLTVVWLGACSLNESAAALKITNEELAISDERLHMAIVGGKIGTWSQDLSTKVFYCSKLCREICGLPLWGELSERDASATVHPEDRGALQSILEHFPESDETCQAEYRVIWPDESIHWVALQGKYFRNHGGEATRREGIVQELTHRKTAEGLNKRLAAILECSDDAILTYDLRGIATSWNPAAERMCGYRAHEMIGQPVGVLLLPGNESAFDEVLVKAKHGEMIQPFETRWRAKNGEVLDVSLAVSPLRDNQGKILGISSVARDNTQKHAVERRLRQAQKMEAVGQLAGGVAHNFNNLVMVINSYAQLIQDQSTDPVVREYATRIAGAGDKAATATSQLLALSRNQIQDLKRVDLNELLQQFCKLLPPVLGEKIQLRVPKESKAAFVKADQAQFEQVLMTLVLNARDAMPHGGTLRIGLDPAELDSGYCFGHGTSIPAGSYAVLSVADTGAGMDSETQARIFEPFLETKETRKGTGLGLATAYGIVKRHGGVVWVYSEVGVGTEFKVYLPLCGPALGPVPEPRKAAAAEGGSHTILIVEDEGSLREVIAQFLTSRGYQTITAENGQAALKLCARWPSRIDLLLTDFIMPGMRGPEVAREVVRLHPETRVIFMSGYADRGLDREDGHAGGHFLQKPLNLRHLAEQIRLALDGVAQHATDGHQTTA